MTDDIIMIEVRATCPKCKLINTYDVNVTSPPYYLPCRAEDCDEQLLIQPQNEVF